MVLVVCLIGLSWVQSPVLLLTTRQNKYFRLQQWFRPASKVAVRWINLRVLVLYLILLFLSFCTWIKNRKHTWIKIQTFNVKNEQYFALLFHSFLFRPYREKTFCFSILRAKCRITFQNKTKMAPRVFWSNQQNSCSVWTKSPWLKFSMWNL